MGVIGVETEYGLQVHLPAPSGWRRLQPDDAASAFFGDAYLDSGNNAFLRNGGRLYLDVGAHPEYATAECRTIADAIAQTVAGHDLMVELADALVRRHDGEAKVQVFANNLDSHGNTYGSHENYQVPRSDDLSGYDAFAGFLVTRQLIAGAGRWAPDGFRLAQRAEHIWQPVSSTSTRHRPMINTRDEPHADPRRWRRLHVMVGDTNLSEVALGLRLASTRLVLAAVERGIGPPSALLVDHEDAIRRVSRDRTGRVRLATRDDGEVSALDVQRDWWQASADFTDDDTAAWHRLWGRTLDQLEAGDLDALANTLDWAAKYRLMIRYAERHSLPPGAPRLAQLDLALHALVGERIADSLGMARVLTPRQRADARTTPPADTRAALRGRVIAAAEGAHRAVKADWSRVEVPGLATGVVMLPDPQAHADTRIDALVAAIGEAPLEVGLRGFHFADPLV